MPLFLVLVLVAVPLAEIAIIIEVGGLIGVGWTIALLALDSLLGAILLRREGARAWQRFRDTLGANRWPGDEVAQGALIILGGALLLTPGFLTDAVGFVLLAPPARAVVARVLRRRFSPLAARGATSRRTAGHGSAGRGSADRGSVGRGGTGRRSGQDGPSVLDVEVVEVERDPPAPSAPDLDPPEDPETGRSGSASS